jgi:N-acetylmuramoyl-L-alanine amidase
MRVSRARGWPLAALVAVATLAACGSSPSPVAGDGLTSAPPSVTSLPATTSATPSPSVTTTTRAPARVTAAPKPAPPKATSKPLGTGSLAGLVIVIDPGHNGGNFSHTAEINRQVDAGFGQRKACNTTGTSTNGGYTEAAYTFDVAQRLAAVLRGRGAKVVMTRTSNSGVGPCIDQRAAIGNAAHASAVLSIHGDGNLAAGARGFQIIVATRMMGGTTIQRDSQALADDVRAAFRSGTGMPYSNYSGGGTAETHRSDIGGLNLSTRPAVMIETGNMRSATDAALMTSAAFRQREAVALAAGLARYLG